MVEVYHSLRGTKDYSRNYLSNLTFTFAQHWVAHKTRSIVSSSNRSAKTVKRVEICKQDSRGALSISMVSHNGCHLAGTEFFHSQRGFIADKLWMPKQ